MANLKKLVEKAPFYVARRIVNRTPLLNKYFLDHYATYKFLDCKFRYKLNILKPLFVQWLATYNCNFHCKHCEANAGSNKLFELKTDEVLKLMTEVRDMGIKRIVISGGEALLRKDIFVIIRHILDEGMHYDMASNSYLVKGFKEEFSSMKPSLFFTSIDGLEETNDEIRGMNGAFRNTFEALDFFRSIGVEHRMINTVVFPGNIEQLMELKNIIMGSSATSWRLATTIPVGRARENEKMYLNPEQMKYLFDFVENARKEFNIELSEDCGYLGCLNLELRSVPFFCGAGLTTCSVMPDGEVLGCQIAYDNKFSEGNIRNKSFKEIWHKGFSRFREPEFNKECLDCRYFDACRGGCWGMRLGNKHCQKKIWNSGGIECHY